MSAAQKKVVATARARLRASPESLPAASDLADALLAQAMSPSGGAGGDDAALIAEALELRLRVAAADPTSAVAAERAAHCAQAMFELKLQRALPMGLEAGGGAPQAAAMGAAMLESSETCVRTHRAWVKLRPADDVARMALARALTMQASSLVQMHSNERAVTSFAESAALLREMYARRPSAYAPMLGMALLEMSTQQHMLNASEASAASATEALAVYRRLATADHGRYAPFVVRSLGNLGNALKDGNQPYDALTHLEEALVLARKLAKSNSQEARSDLAFTLDVLAAALGQVGQLRRAAELGEEAVAVSRLAAKSNPTQLPELASAISSLAARWMRLFDFERAAAPAAEAVKMFRELDAADFVVGRFRHMLARSLLTQGTVLYHKGDVPTGLANAAEAVRLLRALVKARPIAYNHELARGLLDVATRECELGDLEASERNAREGIKLLREIDRIVPGVYAPLLGVGLVTLARTQTARKQYSTALTTGAESVQLLQRIDTASAPGLYSASVGEARVVVGQAAFDGGDRERGWTEMREGLQLLSTAPGPRGPNAILDAYADALVVLSDRARFMPPLAAPFLVRHLRAAVQLEGGAKLRSHLAAALALVGTRLAAEGNRDRAAASFAESVTYLM